MHSYILRLFCLMAFAGRMVEVTADAGSCQLVGTYVCLGKRMVILNLNGIPCQGYCYTTDYPSGEPCDPDYACDIPDGYWSISAGAGLAICE